MAALNSLRPFAYGNHYEYQKEEQAAAKEYAQQTLGYTPFQRLTKPALSGIAFIVPDFYSTISRVINVYPI